MKLRDDLAIIAGWIPPNSRVLDLGCGDGMLLQWLCEKRNCRGYGVEISSEKVNECINKNINVKKNCCFYTFIWSFDFPLDSSYYYF